MAKEAKEAAATSAEQKPEQEVKLTESEIERGISPEEKERQIENSEVLDEVHQTGHVHRIHALQATHDAAREKELRDFHLADNPALRTQVDNNPYKVKVFVNRTSYTVPPGPMPLALFKQIVGMPGLKLSFEGQILGDDAMIELNGGEMFFTFVP